jgi:predicted ATPase
MFKLIEIEFINHPFFKSIVVKFVDDGEELAENYATLIIGPNGTGKSKILLAAISIFNSLELLFKGTNKKYSFSFRYKLKFISNNRVNTVDFSAGELLINGSNYSSIGHFDLPSKVLVSAFSFNDKYPLREQRGKVINENYHYLGLKSTNNNIFLGNPTKSAISNLYGAIIDKKDISPLREAFTTLELKPILTLVYKPGKYFKFLQNGTFLEGRSMSTEQFSSLFTEFFKKTKKKAVNPELKRLGNDKIEKLLNDTEKVLSLTKYLKENIQLVMNLSNREILLKPTLDFDTESSFNEFTKHVLPLQLLSDLEIISFQRFEIKKLNTNFSFDDASSGEYHIILSYLNILSLIENNSLVIMDEPEISLHPNWQIKYMYIFNKIFSDFSKSHFIIASHSHFLVSDLKSENSHIIAIDLDERGEINLSAVQKNTYGWSAEQILLDVFKVATTRNYYLTRVIGKILEDISSKNVDRDKVKQEIIELKKYDIETLNDNDPMKLVIKKLIARTEIN